MRLGSIRLESVSYTHLDVYKRQAEGAKADRILNTDIYAVARGAEGATVGTGVGALVALILCMLIYLLYRRVLKRQMRRDKSRHVESYLSVWKTLVLILLPIIFNSAIYNISSLIDNSIFGHYTEFVGITPVSYTHLDVYKRQLLLIC